MLKNLIIKNLALIDEVKVSFTSGFNVFTGETGAGKSILIGALGLLLGGKADKSLIKEGKNFAKIEAIFDTTHNIKIEELFNEIGIESDETISLFRLLNINGKSEYRINGEIVTLNVFKKFASELIDVFGQHDNQQLLNSKNHILFLDKYIGQEVEELKTKLSVKLSSLNEINKTIISLGGDEKQREREIDLLNYEINQIKDANFYENEDEELLNKKSLLVNSEKISRAITDSLNNISGTADIPMLLKEVVSLLGSISGLDTSIDDCRTRIQSLRWEMEDINNTLLDYSKTINYDENELNRIEDRLDLINNFKRKYGNTISDILLYLDNAQQKRDMLLNCDKQLEEENAKKLICLQEIQTICNKIHDTRLKYKGKLESEIIKELQDLGMKSAKFVIDDTFDSEISKIENNVSNTGLDKIEFLFSANLGVEPRPLDKIISGGELSRFSLAFKTIVNTDNSDKTLIFDEIDTGIGGDTGSVVGKKITKISRHNQVLCITHLAQIASFADSHFKIVKTENDGHTFTNIYFLNNEDRQEEIVRMIGSINNNSYAILHSNELISESIKFKKSL